MTEDFVRYTLSNGDEFGVRHVRTGKHRCIFISDIHGETALLKRLLEEIGFGPEDLLFLLGDICEKGTDSLEALRYVMELCQSGNAYALQGNCDVWNKELNPARPTPWLGSYLAFRKQTLVADMCREQGICLQEDMDLYGLKQQLWKSYQPELQFLDSLPRIIETDCALLVHASIQQEDPPYTDQAHLLVKCDDWAETAPSFQKWVICGHTPVMNYCNTICDCCPRVDREKHIISIDGGNVINACGQLNALIIEDEMMQTHFVDTLPVCHAIAAQTASEDPITTNWFHAGVEILDYQEEQIVCRHLDSGRILKVPAERVYTRKGQTVPQIDTWTDYRLPVEPGDCLKLCEIHDDWCLCKKNGILGQVPRALLEL